MMNNGQQCKIAKTFGLQFYMAQKNFVHTSIISQQPFAESPNIIPLCHVLPVN